MQRKRSYDDGCATAHALDLVGERWALLVVRELMFGPKRFTNLRAGLHGISPNVLTQRLADLEDASIVLRRKLPPPASAWVYELSPWGLELAPVIRAIGKWAARSPYLPEDAPMSGTSVALSLTTMFASDFAGGMEGDLGLAIGEERYVAHVRTAALTIDRGEPARLDVSMAGDPGAFAQVIYGGLGLDAAIADHRLSVSGDLEVARRFVAMFPLPDRAPDLRDADARHSTPQRVSGA